MNFHVLLLFAKIYYNLVVFIVAMLICTLCNISEYIYVFFLAPLNYLCFKPLGYLLHALVYIHAFIIFMVFALLIIIFYSIN